MEVFFIDDIDKLLGEGFSLHIRIDTFSSKSPFDPIVYTQKCPPRLIVNFLKVVEDFIQTDEWANHLLETNAFRFELSKDENGDLKINQPK
jgi:hypothetical protein